MYLNQEVKEEVDLGVILKSKLYSGIRVDFWIPKYSCVIEVHGIQHYKISGFGANDTDAFNSFQHQQNRDHRLKEVCKLFKLNYIEIPYTDKVDAIYIYKMLAELKGKCDEG